MIKCSQLGMKEVSKNNPKLTSMNDVTLYDFLVVDGVTYLIANALTGDDAYKDDVVLKAGEFLRGFDVKAWENQELDIDAKHIAFGKAETYKNSIAVGTLLAVVTAGEKAGKLAIVATAPTDAGTVYFKVTKKCTLTEDAVEAKVLVAGAAGSDESES